MQTKLCGSLMDILFGQSVDQKNYSMQPVYGCHLPSGCSLKQVLHFGQQVNWWHFGKYMTNLTVPCDYDLSKIRVPVSLHYSTVDKFTNPIGKSLSLA